MNDYLNGHASDWYAGFVSTDTAAVVDAWRRDPDAAVTTCGEWNLTRLVQHLGSVHRWAGHIVEHGAAPTDRSALTAPEGADLGEWLIAGADELVDRLGPVDGEAECWNPWPIPQIAGVWPRRMAQETSMHRFDAENAVGDSQPFDATLASDGIDEYFRLTVPRSEAEGVAIPPSSLHVHCTDVDGEWLIRTDDGYRVTREHVKGDAALRGTANDLLLALWGRPVGADAIEIAGDRAAAEAWLAIGGR